MSKRACRGLIFALLLSLNMCTAANAAVIPSGGAVHTAAGGSAEGGSHDGAAAKPDAIDQADAAAKTDASTSFGQHGRLSVQGVDLVDQNGQKFQLKGVSTHGLQWFPQYVSKESFATLQGYGANTVRLALYTAEGGYTSGGNRAELEKIIDRGVQAAAELGIYVILDWHILSDGNPNQHTAEAVDFFGRMAAKYGSYGNVLYEICNEPNGGVQWAEIKRYADQVIPAIRQYDSTGIILVGTPTWSQDVEKVAAAPVAQSANVMYTLHFYAGTHRDNIRSKLSTARQQGTPVFVSEFSICDASGNGGIDYRSAEAWKQLIRETGVSYIGWSLCNKAESAALISSNCSKTSGWTDAELSETGRWLKEMLAT